MPMITFTWNTIGDERVCPICGPLHGFSWIFQDEMPTVLEHPKTGAVWDLTMDQPRTHGLQVYNCRCWLTIEIDDSDLVRELELVKKRKRGLDTTLSSVHRAVKVILAALEAT